MILYILVFLLSLQSSHMTSMGPQYPQMDYPTAIAMQAIAQAQALQSQSNVLVPMAAYPTPVLQPNFAFNGQMPMSYMPVMPVYGPMGAFFMQPAFYQQNGAPQQANYSHPVLAQAISQAATAAVAGAVNTPPQVSSSAQVQQISAPRAQEHKIQADADSSSNYKAIVHKLAKKRVVRDSTLSEEKEHRHKNKNIMCIWPECKATFATKWSRDRHIKGVHQRLKPLMCTRTGCSKRFAAKETLKRHLDAHKGIKRYKCPACPVRLADRTNINKHRLVCEHFKKMQNPTS